VINEGGEVSIGFTLVWGYE